MITAWLFSRKVRQAAEMVRQLGVLIHEQRDILPPESLAALVEARDKAWVDLKADPTSSKADHLMKLLEQCAAAHLKPHPLPAIRENIKEILSAMVLIMAFTQFFLQLTKIPTGSMQPTLFGITSVDLRGKADVRIPGFAERLWLYWTRGISHKRLVAPEDGVVNEIEPARTLLPFVRIQRFRINERWLTTWFVPEEFERRAAVRVGQTFKKGEELFNLRVVSGDHLLVDRLTYNFREPKRGEIIVFKTRSIPTLDQDLLYIKRLVGLPGEELRVGADQHIVVNGRRLTAADRHFEMVYDIDRGHPEFPYRGHVNEHVARHKYGAYYPLAPLFEDGDSIFKIRPGHVMAMGDNTMNSQDSRSWGDLPEENVLGKCWFVYWPLTDRFGWGYR